MQPVSDGGSWTDNLAFALVVTVISGVTLWLAPHKLSALLGLSLGLLCMVCRIWWFEGRLLRPAVPPPPRLPVLVRMECPEQARDESRDIPLLNWRHEVESTIAARRGIYETAMTSPADGDDERTSALPSNARRLAVAPNRTSHVRNYEGGGGSTTQDMKASMTGIPLLGYAAKRLWRLCSGRRAILVGVVALVGGCATKPWDYPPPYYRYVPQSTFFSPPRSVVPVVPSVAIPSVGSGHWIAEVIRDGSILQLEDGSLWEVSPLDRIYTAIWLPISEVVIVEGDDPLYPFRIVNTDDREVANVRMIIPR
jgi:hypothetical protein